MENNEIAANGMISENTENTENKCAEKTNGVAGPGRNAYDVLNERRLLNSAHTRRSFANFSAKKS